MHRQRDGDPSVRGAVLPGRLHKGQTEVVIRREGQRVVLEGARRAFSRRFLDLAGSAKDFPCPDEPPEAEEGPRQGRAMGFLRTLDGYSAKTVRARSGRIARRDSSTDAQRIPSTRNRSSPLSTASRN